MSRTETRSLEEFRHDRFLRGLALGSLGLFVLLIAGLIGADILYLWHNGVRPAGFCRILAEKKVAMAIWRSLYTSLITLLAILISAIPVGYALSRCRFRGHAFFNTVVDVPIVLPPVLIGISLLAFFGTGMGRWLRDWLYYDRGMSLSSWIGIVMCQYLVAVSYCIRAVKASFDTVDRRLEQVAFTLGCSSWQVFRRVTLPLARNGLIAGAIMAWARAVGVFGPLMVFVGTMESVEVVPTKMYLEISVGNIEVALAVALVSLFMAGLALAAVHKLAPGRHWT